MIKPLESELVIDKPETLIFINDGLLRNVPMAALYDGKEFLVENFALGNSLGLNLKLKKTESSLLKRALALGLSEETNEFISLPYVQKEIELMAQIVDTKAIIDKKFTQENTTSQLTQNNFPLVHIATHGQFGGTLEDSFLLTYEGNGSDKN